MKILSKPLPAAPLLTINRQSADSALSFIKPGQRISAQVQSSSINGSLNLNINDRVLKVVTDLQLTQGSKIDLKVELKEGQLVLRLLTPQNVAIPTPQQALRQVLPRQQPMLPLLTQLARLATQVETGQSSHLGHDINSRTLSSSPVIDLPALPPKVREALNTLMQQLPSHDKLTRADGLKDAINNSGMFFESRLAQSADKASMQGDLKTILLRIAALLRQSLETLPTQATRPLATPTAEGRPETQPHNDTAMKQAAAAAKQAETTALLQQLGRQGESSLARVQMNQLTSLQSQSQNEEPYLILELPLFNGKESEIIKLKIQRETRQNGNKVEACWSVTLKLDNEAYGEISAVVSLINTKVSTTFWCTQEKTQQHFQQHLGELRERIQEQGLELGHTQAVAGAPPKPDRPNTPSADENLINFQA